jgi:hypothetical protein
MAVLAHIHCGTSRKRRYVTVDQIAKFILKDSLNKLSKARREDVREAFEKVRHRELVEMLSFLVQYLSKEGALIADSGVVGDFRVCRDELRVLDGVHQTMYPKLKIVPVQPTLMLVNKVG